MPRAFKVIAAALVLTAALAVVFVINRREDTVPMLREKSGQSVRLATPRTAGGLSFAEALTTRRSQREFSDQPLSKEQISQLCWAAQGITDRNLGFRTAPSAGALFPATIFVVACDGVSEYEPTTHSLRQVVAGDLRMQLQAAAHDQPCVGTAPVCLVIAMDISRTSAKYGSRAERYCLIEAGHIAQNVLLQATTDGLAAVPVGAFDDARIAAILRLPRELRPVYLLPIGHAK